MIIYRRTGAGNEEPIGIPEHLRVSIYKNCDPPPFSHTLTLTPRSKLAVDTDNREFAKELPADLTKDWDLPPMPDLVMSPEAVPSEAEAMVTSDPILEVPSNSQGATQLVETETLAETQGTSTTEDVLRIRGGRSQSSDEEEDDGDDDDGDYVGDDNDDDDELEEEEWEAVDLGFLEPIKSKLDPIGMTGKVAGKPVSRVRAWPIQE
jgi:hypothetical protein